MSEESNLLKLVAEVGAKIEAVKLKISAGGIENEKWKTHLLESRFSTVPALGLLLRDIF